MTFVRVVIGGHGRRYDVVCTEAPDVPVIRLDNAGDAALLCRYLNGGNLRVQDLGRADALFNNQDGN